MSAFLLLLVLVLATGGGWRAILEGSCCYVLAGMAMLAAAVLLGLERRAAAWVYGGVVLATVGVAIGIGFAFVPHGVTQLATPGQAQTTDNASVTRVPTGASSANAPAHGDWTAYGGSNAATRYVCGSQINRDNVGRLQRAWTYRTGDIPESRWGVQTTALKVGDMLYLCTARNILVGLA